MRDLKELSANLSRAVAGLGDSQLDTPYRPGGWTVRQVVHHLPDSHMQAYSRSRMALTENSPLITPYDEAAWADLVDARSAAIDLSLSLLEHLHARWVALLRSLDEADLARTLRHPEWREKPLEWMVGLYAWHGRHHVAHILNLRNGEGW